VVGPELSVYGSIVATAINSGRVVVGTLQERVGDITHLPCHCGKRYASSGWARLFAAPYREQYRSIVNPSASGTVAGLQIGLDLYRHLKRKESLNLAGLYFAYANTHPTIKGTITNTEATGFIKTHTGSVNLNANTIGAYWTHLGYKGSYLDVVTQVSTYRGKADSYRVSLPLYGEGILESAEIGYPLHFSPCWTFQPEFQLIHQYIKFHNTQDIFSEINLNSNNTLIGRAGAQLKYTIPVNRYAISPYLRANLWSTRLGDNNMVFANTDHIITSTKRSWVQLDSGITVNVGNNLGIYAFVDGLINTDRSIRGINSGLGMHIFL
jgi:outer membrane autotransporter protein